MRFGTLFIVAGIASLIYGLSQGQARQLPNYVIIGLMDFVLGAACTC